MGTLTEFFTAQNIFLFASAIVTVLFLRSGIVKQLIGNLKQLGTVQETLLTAKDKEMTELADTVKKLEGELADEKKENRRLRDYDYDSREKVKKLERERNNKEK